MKIDALLYFGMFALIILLIIGIPIAITYFIFRILKKKFPKRPYKWIAFLPTLLLIYSIWSAFFPSEDFYKNDFKEVTQMAFPKESNFLFKSATFPDNFGDYTSVFMFRTDTGSYNEIKTQILKNNFKAIVDDKRHVPDSEDAIKMANLKINDQYTFNIEGGKNYYIAFFEDGKTILVRRISW